MIHQSPIQLLIMLSDFDVYLNLVVAFTGTCFLSVSLLFQFDNQNVTTCEALSIFKNEEEIKSIGVALSVISIPLLYDGMIHYHFTDLFPNIFVSRGILACRCIFSFATLLLGSQLFFQYKMLFYPSFEASATFMINAYRIILVTSIMFFISISDQTKKSVNLTITVSFLCVLSTVVNTPNLFNTIDANVKNIIESIFTLSFSIFLLNQRIQIRLYPKAYISLHSFYVNICSILWLFTITKGFYVLSYSKDNNITILSQKLPMFNLYFYVILCCVYYAVGVMEYESFIRSKILNS